MTSDGIKTQIGAHTIERAKQRGVSLNGVPAALTEPLSVGKIKYDDEGRPSKQYVGEKVTAAVNPDTGVIITVWKTSAKKAAKLRGGKE